MNLKSILEMNRVTASVPCRIDLGGTLDISTFHLPLQRIRPSSFNIALGLRTHITLSPYRSGSIKISSKGFDTAQFERGRAPYNHPMGLMFAIADYFDAHGVHIHIESTSPPRSALGGSSSAAVAIISAIFSAMGVPVDKKRIAWLAHYIEASVAGVPCGVQDQLAAAFGGVHQWFWKMGDTAPEFEGKAMLSRKEDEAELNEHILVAYCGIPHVSKDINGQWVRSFVGGKNRDIFIKIAELTNDFSTAVRQRNFGRAARLMNRETAYRLDMTPDVLDNTGKKLFEMAKENNCGARFTGAGGGGCLWAIGEKESIRQLNPLWHGALEPVAHAAILNAGVDNKGILLG